MPDDDSSSENDDLDAMDTGDKPLVQLKTQRHPDKDLVMLDTNSEYLKAMNDDGPLLLWYNI